MNLHVLTAVTRPDNLATVARSLAQAAKAAPEINVTWHWRFDTQGCVGGQAIKNEMMAEVDDGWVWVLDDDTIAHPDVLRSLSTVLYESDPRVVIVSQKRADGDRFLSASRDNVRVGGIDIGQAFIDRDVIEHLTIPESYEGDGLFLERVLDGLADTEIVFLTQVLSFHNYLRPGTS